MVSMINKKYIKYLVIMFGMLVAALAFSILEILYLSLIHISEPTRH